MLCAKLLEKSVETLDFKINNARPYRLDKIKIEFFDKLTYGVCAQELENDVSTAPADVERVDSQILKVDT